MTNTHSKEYSATLHAAAMRIVSAYIEKTQQYLPGRVALKAMADEMMVETGCTYVTARGRVHKALRILRNPDHAETKEWGGARDGSGWPKGKPRKVDQMSEEN